MAGEIPETFAEFTSSFSGGSRNDLSFKFLRAMDPPAAAELLRVLLDEPGSLFDSGDPSALIDAAIAGQQGAYGARALDDHYRYEEVPFTRPSTPVAESRVALVTSSGHFAARHDPRPFGVEGMTQQEAVAPGRRVPAYRADLVRSAYRHHRRRSCSPSRADTTSGALWLDTTSPFRSTGCERCKRRGRSASCCLTPIRSLGQRRR